MFLKNKNLLPLLAITGIFLSLALVAFINSETKNNNTQAVLSKSTETVVLPTATPRRTFKPPGVFA